MHPAVTLLDAAEQPVQISGEPISDMRTCGACHDTQYIESHNFHTEVGLENCIVEGMLGANGLRHVGGGDLAPEVELDCLLCHLQGADIDARRSVLMDGAVRWASTATLASTGLVEPGEDGTWIWTLPLSQESPALDQQQLPIQAATSEACGACHGTVWLGDEPLQLDLRAPCSSSTGQVFSDQRISESSLSVAGKEQLTRSWDVHAEHLMACTSCHHAANNPAFFFESDEKRPSHLRFDGRRLDLGAYLERPNHQLAKGHSTQGTVAERLDGTMRDCVDCHDPRVSHDWLPHADAHMRVLSCEACHVPSVHIPARAGLDWTLPSLDGQPRQDWRGVRGDVRSDDAFIDGFVPLLLPRTSPDDGTRLYPYNITLTWFWVAGEDQAPVPMERVRQVTTEGQRWAPGLLALLDANTDGQLQAGERVLNTPEAVRWVAQALERSGLERPVIKSELRPYGLHHGVAGGGWATRDCARCHDSGGSQVEREFMLADLSPVAEMPELVAGANVLLDGELLGEPGGSLSYRTAGSDHGLYVPGDTSTPWVNRLGLLAVLGALLGTSGHGALRILAARRRRNSGAAKAAHSSGSTS